MREGGRSALHESGVARQRLPEPPSESESVSPLAINEAPGDKISHLGHSFTIYLSIVLLSVLQDHLPSPPHW